MNALRHSLRGLGRQSALMLVRHGLLCVTVLLAISGCNRSYYRRQADVEVYNLVSEKTNFPHWPLERRTIDIDPRSRMFDPFNPDRPPMPPDDPTSHKLMHYVDGKKGYPHWHANGDTPFVENPFWMSHLPVDEDGVVTLNGDRAVRLALLHSRDYQSQFETLYLSALDVSAERFRFDSQFFATHSTFFTADGPDRRGDGQSHSVLEVDTTATMRKAFTTGAELVVGFANSLVWDFSGPDTFTGTTIFDFMLLQPLLRGAGRDRILETLTIAERTLLANVRQMERFRRAFYVEIMTGRNAGQGATRRGGFFGASGFAGFSGVGGGGFGTVGGLGGGGGFGAGGTGGAQAGGYIGLLQSQQQIRNQEATIAGLRSNLNQLRETLKESLTKIPESNEDIVRQRLQIAQARQALFNAESQLLSLQNEYQTDLDNFKMTLGLPPTLCLKIDDPMLDEFNLIDTEIVPIQNAVTDLQNQVGIINEEILDAVEYEEVAGRRISRLQWTDQLEANLRQVKARLRQFKSIHEKLEQVNLARAQEDVERAEAALPERREQIMRLRQRYAEENSKLADMEVACQRRLTARVDPTVFDTERLKTLPQDLNDELARLRQQAQGYHQPLAIVEQYIDDLLAADVKPDPEAIYQGLETQVIFGIPNLLATLNADVLDLSLVQARARTESVQLVEVELSSSQAIEIARRYRRDWMNARASLVDAWRLIEFNADNLESSVDIVFSGDIRNSGTNPIRLRGTAGQLRAGIQFDAPITRLQERNTYRQALIEYQQARRNYYEFEDGIAQGLRATLRTIEANTLNFEERRLAVVGAIEQIVLNGEIQRLRDLLGQTSGATAARDVVSALSDLQDGQNVFLGVWISVELLRRSLDLDLGTMQLDSDGIWIDPGAIDADFAARLLADHDNCPPDIFLPADSVAPLPSKIPEAGEPIPAGPARPQQEELTSLLPATHAGAATTTTDVVPAPLNPLRATIAPAALNLLREPEPPAQDRPVHSNEPELPRRHGPSADGTLRNLRG